MAQHGGKVTVVLECVINVSEGHDGPALTAIVAAAGEPLDVHRDEHHNRAVLTLGGDAESVESAARAVARTAVEHLDLRSHRGVHPRIGVVDVVPFVPLGETAMTAAVDARDRFAAWAGAELDLPCFLYGPNRTLPDLRRNAFHGLAPDTGPTEPHRTAGACAVGARAVLVAYNVWLANPSLGDAKRLAAAVRRPDVRALALTVGDAMQVSMNLLAPLRVGPADVFDLIAAHAEVARAELVGLVPAAVLDASPSARWRELDLDESRTIEARLEATGC